VRKLRRTTPVIYEVFDLLWLDGDDLGRSRSASDSACSTRS